MAFQRYLQGARNYLHHRATGAQTKPASVQTGLLDLVRIFCECPSSCSPLLHFQEPTTIPSRPTMVYEDHRRRLRLIHRVSAHRKRAPEIVDERPALLGMNRAMLRNLAGPRPARRAQRTHWQSMFGAQVDSIPSHRCPSHVRLPPALVSAPPHVPARPFVWGCGS